MHPVRVISDVLRVDRGMERVFYLHRDVNAPGEIPGIK